MYKDKIYVCTIIFSQTRTNCLIYIPRIACPATRSNVNSFTFDSVRDSATRTAVYNLLDMELQNVELRNVQ